MKRHTFIMTAAALALGALATTTVLAHGPGGGFGPGSGPMNGQGPVAGQMGGYSGQMGGYSGQMGGYHHGGGYGYHHGGDFNRGGGWGPGNADCFQNQALETPLTVDDVRTMFEKRLEWRGNDRLKVGTVEEIDENTIAAEIVTVDDSLVQRIEIDKNTGRHAPTN